MGRRLTHSRRGGRGVAGCRRQDAAPDAPAQVLTPQRPRGVEFDHVVIVGCEQGEFPSRRADEDGAFPKERQLFYVGGTRAKRSWCLSWVRQRREWPSRPSRFLADIPRHLLERASARSRSTSGSAAASPARPPRALPPPTCEEADRLVAEFLAKQKRPEGRG